jgi:uncharacterized protein YjiS (DUF1127 family)
MTTNTALWGAEKPQTSGLSFSGIVAKLRRDWSRRRTHLLLADLDDHTLDDIGLDPSHVRRTRRGLTDWVIQTQSGTARLVFIGR